MNSALDRLPLRIRLVAGLVVLVAVGLLVAGLAATSALRSDQLDRVDAQLTQAVDSPALRRQGPRDRPGAGRRADRPGLRDRLPGELYVAVLDADGAVVRADAAVAGPDLPSLTAAEVRARSQRPFTVDAAAGGGSWRVVAVGLTGRQSAVVAADLREVDRTVERLAALQALIGFTVLLGISGVGYLVVRASLRGLADVEEAAAAVAAGELSRRVPERDRRTEIGSLAVSFNEMVSPPVRRRCQS
jgi:two-component system OmpR family sensor kinase